MTNIFDFSNTFIVKDKIAAITKDEQSSNRLIFTLVGGYNINLSLPSEELRDIAYNDIKQKFNND